MQAGNSPGAARVVCGVCHRLRTNRDAASPMVRCPLYRVDSPIEQIVSPIGALATPEMRASAERRGGHAASASTPRASATGRARTARPHQPAVQRSSPAAAASAGDAQLASDRGHRRPAATRRGRGTGPAGAVASAGGVGSVAPGSTGGCHGARASRRRSARRPGSPASRSRPCGRRRSVVGVGVVGSRAVVGTVVGAVAVGVGGRWSAPSGRRGGRSSGSAVRSTNATASAASARAATTAATISGSAPARRRARPTCGRRSRTPGTSPGRAGRPRRSAGRRSCRPPAAAGPAAGGVRHDEAGRCPRA